MTHSRGYTLAELSVGLAITGLFILLLATLLGGAKQLSQASESEQDAAFQLQKVRASLTRDFKTTRHERTWAVRMGKTGTTPPNIQNAILGLTAFDHRTLEFIRRDDGKPRWANNVFYYTAIPRDHDRLYGGPCPNQLLGCPHKFLIRRIIRYRPLAAKPTKPEPSEERIPPPELADYCLIPDDYYLGFPDPASEPPMVLEDRLVATNLLDFQVDRSRPDGLREIVFKVAAHRSPAERPEQRGEADLSNSKYTEWMEFSVFPDS